MTGSSARDLRGHGQTALPRSGRARYSACAAHLDAFIDAVAREEFDMILALDWATSNPARIRKLVVLNTIAKLHVRWALLDRQLWSGDLVFGPAFVHAGFALTARRPSADLHLARAWAHPWSRRRVLRGMDFFARSHGQELASRLPHGRYAGSGSCGHWAPLDAPQRLAQAVDASLTGG